MGAKRVMDLQAELRHYDELVERSLRRQIAMLEESLEKSHKRTLDYARQCGTLKRENADLRRQLGRR